MRASTIGLLFVAVLAAQQTSRQYSSFSEDMNGRRVIGPSWSETRTPTSFERTVSMRSINGQIVPQESVQQRLLRDSAREKIFERTVQLYDYDGKPLPPQRIRIEERKNPDGSTTVINTTYQQDLNGRFQVVERATGRVVASEKSRSESTVVERPNLSGSMEVVEKLSSIETKGPTQEQQQVVTYRKGINGDFYEASRQVTERVKQEGLVTETMTQFEAGGAGQLQPATRTVSQIRTLPDKSEIRESTIYRPWTAGRVDQAGGFRASEQLLVEKRPGPGNTVVETTSVRTPSLNHPYTMGKYQKVSEVLCSGQCRPDQQAP